MALLEHSEFRRPRSFWSMRSIRSTVIQSTRNSEYLYDSENTRIWGMWLNNILHIAYEFHKTFDVWLEGFLFDLRLLALKLRICRRQPTCLDVLIYSPVASGLRFRLCRRQPTCLDLPSPDASSLKFMIFRRQLDETCLAQLPVV